MRLMSLITFAYVYLGMKLGENWKSVGSILDQYMSPLGIFIVLLLILWMFLKRRKQRAKTEKISQFVKKLSVDK